MTPPQRARSGGEFLALLGPAGALAAAGDVVAGYVLAAPVRPAAREAVPPVLILGAGAVLLLAGGRLFAACFAPVPRGGFSAKRLFLAGALLSVVGLFSAMGAAFLVGRLPVYFASFLFLVLWARAGPLESSPLAGPVSWGAVKSLSMALGMAAHPDFVYRIGHPGTVVPLALLFSYGALFTVVRRAEAEGGRRYLLVLCGLGLAGIIAGGAFVGGTSLAALSALGGGLLVGAGLLRAVRSLAPAGLRTFAERALVAGCLLDAALAFGRWRPEGFGAAAALLVVPCQLLLGYERSEALRMEEAGA